VGTWRLQLQRFALGAGAGCLNTVWCFKVAPGRSKRSTSQQPRLVALRPCLEAACLEVPLRDNGAPGQSVPDEVHPVVFDDRPRQPNFSPCNIPPQVWYPVDKGNFAVHDATN
jgi:hypothetical protein